MNERTAQEVGAILRTRREALGLRQEGIEGVSSSTVRNVEKGTDTERGRRGLTLAALMRALQWPPDAFDRLLAGEDPAGFDRGSPVIEVSASGVDLDELRQVDPEAYELVMTMARAALDRANERRGRG